MAKEKVIIIMGSKSDQNFSVPICSMLKRLGIPYEQRVCSAHKTPQKLLELLEDYESTEDKMVYITVAGRANALSGIVDANTRFPVIACPPQSESFGGADIYSSLRMPSGVAPLVVLDPENAALAAAKILAISDAGICEKVLSIQQEYKRKVELDDEKLKSGN